MTKLGQLFDSGELKMTVEAVFPLEQAVKAVELNETGRVRGKVIVRVID